MPRRIALLFLILACLAPALARRSLRAGTAAPPGAPCDPEGRGRPPAHWIGCRGDPGEARPFTGTESVLLGRPVDLNRASEEDLAAVPGLGPALARAVVAERAERGAFARVEELRRVRGVGPARLARAREFLVAGRDAPPP